MSGCVLKELELTIKCWMFLIEGIKVYNVFIERIRANNQRLNVFIERIRANNQVMNVCIEGIRANSQMLNVFIEGIRANNEVLIICTQWHFVRKEKEHTWALVSAHNDRLLASSNDDVGCLWREKKGE